MNKKSLADLRREYAGHELSENDVEENPVKQFDNWFHESLTAEVPDVNAVSLGTATKDGRPSVRIVLLKSFGNEGFVFYTNYHSRKGRELEANPFAALTFYWHPLNRQVRIEGKIKKVSPEESDEYFHVRPRGSQVAAHASPQSEPIAKEALESRFHTLEAEFKDAEIERPEHWGGYILVPEWIEFWQGRPNRLHDRIVYFMENGQWKIERIAP